MSDALCGCCEGVGPRTPRPTANRPGLEALRYRVGVHADFLETMLAQLSTHHLPDGRRPLGRLTARTPDDPAVALLDAWATVADVLTFYQERIANEGYLLTATERRSILELSRLTGYRLRPGVAASVYLAFQMERDQTAEIPASTKAQSLPEPGELPQTFETDEPLEARAEWNAISPRLTRPTVLRPDPFFDQPRVLHLEGAVTNLRTNDAFLVVCGDLAWPRRIVEVEADPEADRTRVLYVPFSHAHHTSHGGGGVVRSFTEGEDSAAIGLASVSHEFPQEAPAAILPPLARLGAVVEALRRGPSVPPPSRFQLVRPLDRIYGSASDLAPRLLTRFVPALGDTLYRALGSAPVTGVDPAELCHVEAFRVRAAVFGHNAPPPDEGVPVVSSLPANGDDDETLPSDVDRDPRVVSLDAVHDGILPGSWVMVDRAGPEAAFLTRVAEVRIRSRASYGISARVTELVLEAEGAWGQDDGETLEAARLMTVYVQAERLPLAPEPIQDPVAGDVLELDGLYDGLEPGRWLVVAGERADVTDGAGRPVEGVEASELVMLAGVEHDVGREAARVGSDEGQQEPGQEEGGDALPLEEELAGDTLHTRLLLAEPLAYTYRRDTVRVNGNVARASHGETHEEVLGSGDGGKGLQDFTLKRAPLTYRSAPTPAGVESTLEVRVDGVRWPEARSLLLLGSSDRGYLTERDDEERTTVLFGDGARGARLPTGVENITAVYRSGLGRAGNVEAEAISLLATRPPGVKEVVNPARASGGADPETRDQARRNVPLAVQALDRLVSVEDYTYFARTFAGIGKAEAWRLPDGRRQVVHLTVAGANDDPVDPSSELFRNLTRALRRLGDPSTPLQVAPREAVFLFLGAGVRVLDDHRWEEVEPRLRTALLEAFGFERRELGQGVRLGEVLAVMQGVEGVDHVDVDFLDGVAESEALDPQRLATWLGALAGAAEGADPCQPRQYVAVHAARVDPSAEDPDRRIRPAQLAYLNPELSDTLVLREMAP